jgi:hypothetical protein
MSQDNDAILSNIIAGLPRVVELVVSVAEDRRPDALAAAEQSYIRTARGLGMDEPEARQWASLVMSRLKEGMRDEAARCDDGRPHWSIVSDNRNS